MRLVNAGYELITLAPWEMMEKHIERAGRLCYKSEGNTTDQSYEQFIRGIIDRGHESVIEHCSFSVLFTVDRGVTHEEVRHRVASFSQESTRYCNYSKDKFSNNVTFIDIRRGIELDKGMRKLPLDVRRAIIDEWEKSIADAERHYMRMLELGATPQIARSVLPNSTKSDIMMTANIREWRWIFKKRVAEGAHPQMREVMIPLLLELQKLSPILFGDITPDNPEWITWDDEIDNHECKYRFATHDSGIYGCSCSGNNESETCCLDIGREQYECEYNDRNGE